MVDIRDWRWGSMLYKRAFCLCFVVENLRHWLFFLSPFTCYLIFVCWSCKGIKDGKERHRNTFKLNSYSTGLLLVSRGNILPDPGKTLSTPLSSRKSSEKEFFWRQEAHLFRHLQIARLVRGLRGNSYFCICLFNFLFISFLFSCHCWF